MGSDNWVKLWTLHDPWPGYTGEIVAKASNNDNNVTMPLGESGYPQTAQLSIKMIQLNSSLQPQPPPSFPTSLSLFQPGAAPSFFFKKVISRPWSSSRSLLSWAWSPQPFMLHPSSKSASRRSLLSPLRNGNRPVYVLCFLSFTSINR
jgi:hypothetical protein